MGLRFPGAKYYGHTALSAHDDMVASGNMGFLLLVGFGLELMSGVALYEAAKGSGREAGTNVILSIKFSHFLVMSFHFYVLQVIMLLILWALERTQRSLRLLN